MNIPVFGFAAYSGTGKTTIIEQVIRALKARGIRTAVIKHDGHGLVNDSEGKDSWRFTQAGADIMIIGSPEKFTYIEKKETSLQQLLAMVPDADIILVEGYKNEPIPRIGIARKAVGKGFTADIDTFLAIMTDLEVPESSVPCFALEDIQGVTEFLIEQIHKFPSKDS